MIPAISGELDAIAALCPAHGVSRLRVFGSAATGLFDVARSDIDFIVGFTPQTSDLFDAYFGLKEGLEQLLGRQVDLVMEGSLTNPYFAGSALSSAEELYAA